MKSILKAVSAITLSFNSLFAFAVAPTYLVTHNNTNEQSNAFVGGTTPSPYPTPANATRQVAWNLVRIACYGISNGDYCTATIKMATDTSNPVVVGNLTMNLKTGDITPKTMTSNGYTITVNGPAQTTITKN